MIVKGIVEHGSGRGKKDFVPTINLILDEVPKDLSYGIYAVKVKLKDSSKGGALHFGPRTSVDGLVTFEVNIFDFDEIIYGQTVEVEILDKLREIVKYESEDDLRSAIEQDIIQAKELLNAF